MAVSNAVQEAFDSNVLSPVDHSQFVLNLDKFARKANILEQMILHKMSDFKCSQAEIEYMRRIKIMASHNVYGMYYVGGTKNSAPVMTRMMAIAGACLRNFVDAKVVTLQELLSDIKDGSPPDVQVLLVPNFFINRAEGGKIAEWELPQLLSVLYTRMMKGQQTFLYVSDFDALRKNYGDPIADHLKNNFRTISA